MNISSRFKIWALGFVVLFTINGAVFGDSKPKCGDLIQKCIDLSNRRPGDPDFFCDAWRGITSTNPGKNINTTDAKEACMQLTKYWNTKNPQILIWTCGTTCSELKPSIACEGNCIAASLEERAKSKKN